MPRGHQSNTVSGRGLWQRLMDSIIQDVPDDLATCEFECCADDCAGPESGTCKLLIRPRAHWVFEIE